jgi:GT2 family glycosyltransferase
MSGKSLNHNLVPVILSYNHEGLTSKCVRSVLVHFKSHGPVYVVHNGTRTEARKKIEEEFPAETFPQLRHVILPVNLQFSGGANAGLEEAFNDGADSVLFLSNDTQLTRFDLEALENHIHGNPAFLLAPQIEKRDTGMLDSFGAAVDLSSGKLEHLKDIDAPRKFFGRDTAVQGLRGARAARFYVPGAAFVISREAWNRVNGFDPSLGSYWEDVDLSLRARRRGVRLGTIPELAVKHGIGKTCHSDPLYTVYYFHRNRRLVSWRHGTKKDRLRFCGVYARDTLGKSFKLLKNKDFSRLKLLLKAVIS